ncbi:hypothetical protein [Streptomyces camponoticapitis]|uniref:hypothetical protein n=1 Tax=Streptomyces camponoticapitis TaxID=1616125 RepID=UPI00166D89BA|nr:hypothetical protein [Streptomyces camponoticapitis]
MAATTSTRRPRGQRAKRWGTGVALATLAALTVAGCGGSDKTDGAGGADTAPPPGQQTSKSPSARPSPAKPSVSAADGSDVGACKDGDCEIAVSEPVTFPFKGPGGEATLSVTEIGKNRVEYTVKSGNGRSEGGATGPGQGCITVLRTTGSGNSCGGLGEAERPGKQPDAVVIQAATGENGTAIVHIVSD